MSCLLSEIRMSAALALIIACAVAAGAGAANVVVPADDFEFQGDWVPQTTDEQQVLTAPARIAYPAATAVNVPKAGRWRLWVCTRDYPDDRPGTRIFAVRVGNTRTKAVFGAAGNAAFGWEDGGSFDLPAGPLLLSLVDAKPFARLQGVVLTDDPKFFPAKPAGTGGFRATPALRLGVTREPGDPLSVAADAKPAAELANDRMRIAFLPATRNVDGVAIATVALRVQVRENDVWADAPLDPAAERYLAVVTDPTAKMEFAGFYPRWATDPKPPPVTLEVGGASLETIPGRLTGSLAEAGVVRRLNPSRAVRDGEAVRLEFHPSPVGTLVATWTLPKGVPAASVSLTFAPSVGGQVCLGYEAPFRRPLADVAELLLPMMYHRHRLPDRPTSLLSNVTPTPVALVQPRGHNAHALAVIGEPADLPFAWPDGRSPRFALSIGDAASGVQPAIYGPVIGTQQTVANVGKPVTLRFRMLAQSGDWYAGFRAVADEVFGLRDYRQNVRTSLSDAALNMIDLVTDDEHGGWWDRAKAWYQIESKNGASHASPMTLMSLYRLTGDERIYRRRALPTIEFLLSRDGPHFSPSPGEGNRYPDGSMNGPSKLFGTSTYAGLWELTGRRTPALAEIALPKDDVRATTGYSHAQAFDEWLSRYLATGDATALTKAKELADQYTESQIKTPPARDLGQQPFFYISFVPNWEGLLRLYEVTGERRYLDAAAFGARQLMTGVWTQPLIPGGDTTIHPGGAAPIFREHTWWKGPVQFRLGWPPARGALAERRVPAWQVSNVGLSFEQPVTFNPRGVARQIWEAAWAPHFLRLSRYTGDKAFETYARNATVGRWGNYPGYYVMGHTDLPQDPRYPFTGPDVTDIYYHHIVPHLAWTIDYLVSEAEVLSEGKIAFPSLRQHGYAYFDSRIFGHAPGKVFDDPEAWLLFRRGLVGVGNRQLNTLLARGRDGFHVILTNQSHAEQRATVTVANREFGVEGGAPPRGTLRVGRGAPQDWAGGEVVLPPRGLALLTLPALKLDVPAHRPAAAVTRSAGLVTVPGKAPVTRAAAIRKDDGAWDAYVWSAASPADARAATLHYSVGGGPWARADDREYPFEFTLPIADPAAAVEFRLDLSTPGGATLNGQAATLSPG